MFSISNTPIDIDALKRQVSTPEAGAFVAFEGWVRENNEGKAVTALEYEAYEELAVKEGQRILEEARKFDILKAYCVHRTGPLKIGDLAVIVVVSSAHRKEAFVACEFIINEIKKRVPIWKRESYADGTTSWVNCAHGHESEHKHDSTHASEARKHSSNCEHEKHSELTSASKTKGANS
jgi:molybdopterin synthase catalytic subunit